MSDFESTKNSHLKQLNDIYYMKMKGIIPIEREVKYRTGTLNFADTLSYNNQLSALIDEYNARKTSIENATTAQELQSIVME